MGSEAVEDCVQGALSSLYPPFESTAPPLLSQSQYLGCLFLHSGWPLCLGEKVVVQLSTLDWRLLRSTDFYLQVVPFSTRCPRLALKCLAPGGRNVKEVLVPESQHPLVFTSEWLHCINKDRGCKREGVGCLDTCLVSTCDGVVRIPWGEVVYPKLLHNPSDPLQDNPDPTDLSSGDTGLDWASSSGEHDSWSWNEEDDLPPDRNIPETGATLQCLRKNSGDLSVVDGAGDYVELLEARGGPDGGADPKQRYLEMHGINKTKTLPLCRRTKAIRIRKGKGRGYGRTEFAHRTGSMVRRDSNKICRHETVSSSDLDVSRPLPRVIDTGRPRSSYLSSFQDSDESARDPVGYESKPSCIDNLIKERKPGVGKEIDETEGTLKWEKHERNYSKTISRDDDDVRNNDESLGERQLGPSERLQCDCVEKSQTGTLNNKHSFAGLESTLNAVCNGPNPLTVCEEADDMGKNMAGRRTRGKSFQDSVPDNVFDSSCCAQSRTKVTDSANNEKTDEILTLSTAERAIKEKKIEETSQSSVSTRGKEIKTGVFRAARRKKKTKRGKGKAKTNTRLQHKGKTDQMSSKLLTKIAQPTSHSSPLSEGSKPSTESKNCVPIPDTLNSKAKDCESQSDTSCLDPMLNGIGLSEPPAHLEPKAPLLRLGDQDLNLLQSGKLIITGTMDRLGRALVVTASHLSEDGWNEDEMIKVLSCYHSITRPMAKGKGLTVIVDSRKSAPSELCLSALKHFKEYMATGLDSVLILTEEQDESPQVCLEGIEHLPKDLGGDFNHCHEDWLAFRLSVEQLSIRCESALTLLEDALQSMNSEPLPDSIQKVPLSMDKHRKLMTSILTDHRLTELQQRGGAWLAGLTNGISGLAQKSPECKAALSVTSDLYNSVDDALHRLVQVSNQRSQDLESLVRLAGMVEKLNKCEMEMVCVQEQLEEYKEPLVSLNKLTLTQHKFRSFRDAAMDLHSETLVLLVELENWSELDWTGFGGVLVKLPPVRERLRNMSHCLTDCWTKLDNTQRLLSTLTEASQWCDVVSSSSPPFSSSSSPLSSLPPIPPSRFHDARALALDLGGGALLDLWSKTLERYQKTLSQFKSRILQAERGTTRTQESETGARGRTQAPSISSLSCSEGEGESEWYSGGEGDGGMQSWGSLASLFKPQNCSTLKITEEKKKEGVSQGGPKFLQNLLHPVKKNTPDAPGPPKPPRKRHPSFDLQALLASRRLGTTSKTNEFTLDQVKPVESTSGQSNPPESTSPNSKLTESSWGQAKPTDSTASQASPLSWLSRKVITDPILTAGVTVAVPGWKDSSEGGRGGGVLIRGVEVSSKEVADHTGFSRQHVLLSRTEREMGTERPGATAQSKLYLQWCRLLSTERQYVALLKGVEDYYLPLLESPDAPSALRGKTESLFSNWRSLSAFHSHLLLPAMEGALSHTLQQSDCFTKYKDQFVLLYSNFIRSRPEPEAPLISQAADYFKTQLSTSSSLSALPFPSCLSAPTQRLHQYCQTLEEMGGVNPTSDSALSILRHAQRLGDDLRASDLITGCPIPVVERGDLVRQGELCVCRRKKKSGLRNVFLYQNYIIFTKHKNTHTGSSVYGYKHSIKTGEAGLTQSVGEDGLRFELWVRQASRTRECVTLQSVSVQERENWSQAIAQLLWSHAINNTELCLKESLCMGVSSKLLLDVTGASELDSNSLSERVQSSCSDSSSVGSVKESDTSTGNTQLFALHLCLILKADLKNNVSF
ncbi:hypothetical protein DNTS_016169 [Danionella cerebrum]|uniref:DH domain-containing protein n=1 Tax=Danionella cerebrum TaxID=2873325 RepID=A0A553MRE2_9TELE|nr:hypothetical protein DNTS_016169 [Danionella translucida]